MAEEIIEVQHKLPKATKPEGSGRSLLGDKSVWLRWRGAILLHGSLWAAESPVARVGPRGLFYSTNHPFCALKTTWLWVSQSWAWREVQGAGGQDADILPETWLLRRVEARQEPGSVSAMTQSLQGFLVMTASAPVPPPYRRPCFVKKSPVTELLMSKHAELPALPQILSPQRVIAVKIGKVMLGNQPPPCPHQHTHYNSQWLNSQSLSLALFSHPFLLCPSLHYLFHATSQARVSRRAPLIRVTQDPWLKEASSWHMLLPSPWHWEGACWIVHWLLKLLPGVTYISYAHFSLAKPSHMAIAFLEEGGEI